MSLVDRVCEYYFGKDLVEDRKAYYDLTQKRFGESIRDIVANLSIFAPRYAPILFECKALINLSTHKPVEAGIDFLTAATLRVGDTLCEAIAIKKATSYIKEWDSALEDYDKRIKTGEIKEGPEDKRIYSQIASYVHTTKVLFNKKHFHGAWQRSGEILFDLNRVF